MATYSRSKKLIKAYKDCRHPYSGTGPVCCVPTRFRVIRFRRREFEYRGRRIIDNGGIFLIIVKATDKYGKKIPKRGREVRRELYR